jgi:hypothetical protein
VFLVNDSKYSKSTGAKPILSPSYIYLVSLGALRAPTPHRPPFWGGGKAPKKAKKENRGRGRGRRVFVALHLQDLSLGESDPRPRRPGPGFSDVTFAYCAFSWYRFRQFLWCLLDMDGQLSGFVRLYWGSVL